MLSFEEINALGNIINTDWGYSSTERGDFPLGTAPQYSIKCQIVADTQPEDSKDLKLVCKYVTIVAYGPDAELFVQRRKFDREAKKLCGDRIKEMKSAYKGATGKGLKTKLVDDNSSCEVIYPMGPWLSFYTQAQRQDRKWAYHRYTQIYQIS